MKVYGMFGILLAEVTKLENEDRSEAARAMGRAKTPAKTAAARENAKLGGRKPGTALTPEHRAKIAEAARKRAAAANHQEIVHNSDQEGQ